MNNILYGIKKFFLFIFLIGSLYGYTQQNLSVFGKSLAQNSTDPETGLIRCVSTEYEEYLKEKESSRESEKQFEEWLAPKAEGVKRILKSGKSTGEIIIIPVVVHVIHSGTGVGVEANISDERVISQITVLNQDYRKMLGTPGYNDNSVGADMEIEFRLAKVDPDGNSTNGINRVSKTGYTWNTTNIENILKPQTQWDPTRYFNIWVCEFGGNLDQTLGYAQFPASSGLSGLQGPYTTNTDGVIIDWKAFGSSDIASGTYYPLYNKGRTLTHEIGHALGLRHIWGDNSYCIVNVTDSYNDYCLDTPAASDANYYCNVAVDSCPADPGNDMIENYMDYTHDTCLNIFTQDQKARILTVLQNSPRRASLTSSGVWMETSEVNQSGSISIYPNPADDVLEIRIPDSEELLVSYEIYSNVGQMIRKTKVDTQSGLQVNTSSLSPGVYVMKLSTTKRTKKIRFIVAR